MQSLQIKPVYSIPEFCESFAVARSVAYEEMKAGRLKTYKIGTATRIAGEDAMAWRDSRRAGKAA